MATDSGLDTSGEATTQAWLFFYESLESNIRLIEDILAQGGPLESIHWELLMPPGPTVPAALVRKHQRLQARLDSVVRGTEESLSVVRVTLEGLPHPRPSYRGAEPMGRSIDVFG